MKSGQKIENISLVLPSLRRGDAIGNETLLMQEALREQGYESFLYAESSSDIANVRSIDALKSLDFKSTVLIYHFSVGSLIPYKLVHLPVSKIVRYHNVTPPYFFRGPSEGQARSACRLGRDQIPLLSVMADRILSDSSYNAQEMRPYSTVEPDVMPLLRNYVALTKEPSTDSIRSYFERYNRETFLFVGRIAPNKCQHDLLELLYLYKKFVKNDARLVLVGGFFSPDYRDDLEKFAVALNLKVAMGLDQDGSSDVVIFNHVSDQDLATLYRSANMFLCASEHEGFCVPVVEAMYFDLPVVAHRAAAVPETVGDAGWLFDKRDKVQFLKTAQEVMGERNQRQQIADKVERRKGYFSLERNKSVFLDFIVRTVNYLERS